MFVCRQALPRSSRVFFSLRESASLTPSPRIQPPFHPTFPFRLSRAMATASTEDGQSLPKRQKVSGPLIGTHNGHFHADEALAVFLLRLLPTYSSSPLIRTRDPAKLAECHTVVDVGGEYDAQRNRYDHHQRGFEAVFLDRATKLSSAGLVYLHFGKQIVAQVTGLSEDDSRTELLWLKLYKDMIEAFDANDNGVSVYDDKATRAAGLEKRFDDKGFSVASVVGRYNNFGKKKDEAPSDPAVAQRVEDERFEKASAFVGEQFLLELNDAFNSWLPAMETVNEAFQSRYEVESGGRIMVLKNGMPWQEHLFNAEEAERKEKGDAAPKVLYILFPENSEPDTKWRIRSVSIEKGGFANRKDLPDAWKGLRDEELSKVSGIPGCVFVHAAGFIGGNATFEGALEMAKKAVEL